MLPANFIIIAILLRFLSGASYLRATWQGKAQPSLVSWGFWSVTALIAFGVQIVRGAGPEAFMTLAIGVSPLAVCAVAIYRGAHRAKLNIADKVSITLTTAGIILWLVSRNPMTALFMSMLADVFSNIPTLLKSYRAPHTEHALAYCISILSMGITLLTIHNWQLTNWLFVAYILGVNVSIALTITVFSKLPGLTSVWARQSILTASDQSDTPRLT